MKFSEQWLREWVNPDIDSEALIEQLTMAGLEVDNMQLVAAVFDDVVVAEVKSVARHPDADRLSVCQIDNGDGVFQVVCGAPNVRTGLRVAMANVGAKLGELKIKKAKLRGVESCGMLCSDKELGLSDQSEGIMELPSDAPVGTPVRDYLALDDNCIEIDLTPNRSDCLGIAGIARDVGTLNRCDVNVQDIPAVAATIDDTFNIDVKAGDACPHYVGRVIRDVNVSTDTPLWMIEKLRRSGIRSLGAVVDITNFVMLELGQPMHAFDLDALNKKIVVRMASDAEEITLLDGKIVKCDGETLLIADQKQPLALAGIMGGENSSVTDGTQHVFLESAFFEPVIIAGKARQMGLHTDSSHRFERGVDPGLQCTAIERATSLVLEICGGKPGPVREYLNDTYDFSRPVIHLREKNINRILGIEMPSNEVEDILTRLGMSVEAEKDGWKVTPPTFRFDISIEADLLEELVRIHGYNNIPRTSPSYHAVMSPRTEKRLPLNTARQLLVDRGYFEAITYSFVDPNWQAILDPDVAPVRLANPISTELSVMRTNLWPGLLKAAAYNLNRQHERVRLFETGLCFVTDAQGALSQQTVIAGVACGAIAPEQWGAAVHTVDFFDLKGDVEDLLRLAGTRFACQDDEFRAAGHPALHPGQSAQIFRGDNPVGWIGAIHPKMRKQLDLDNDMMVFQLRVDGVLDTDIPKFRPLSKFPEVRRDLAILVEDSVSSRAIVDCIYESAGDLLQDVLIFDIFSGKGIKTGLKSVALGLILQDFSSTLTDEKVEHELHLVVAALNHNLAATLRE